MKKIIYIFVGMLALSGCGKFLQQHSQDLVVVKNATELDEVLLGSGYISGTRAILDRLPKSKVSPWMNMIDDNINAVIAENIRNVNIYNYYIEFFLFGYSTWQLDVTRSLDENNERADDDTWNTLYAHINTLNVVLSEADRIDLPSSDDKLKATKIKAEAHFLRAWYYLHLTNLYGEPYAPSTAKNTLGVPLKLTHYVEHDPGKATYQFERAKLDKLYAQIVKDLQESISLFSQTEYKTVKYRASLPAAQLLLSRVYLYMQDWDNARKFAELYLATNPGLININTIKNGEKIFLDTENVEVIFSQGPLNLQLMFQGTAGDYCVSRDLYDIYAENDVRKTVYFKLEVDTDSVCLNRKYKMGGTDVSRISDVFTLRNSEAYLNLAEAYAMLNQPAMAAKWLNELRANRLEKFDGKDTGAEDIYKAVRDERRRELCFEGHRWFDLRRYMVLEQQKYSRVIYRSFGVYVGNFLSNARQYALEENDPAYTFQIPKSVVAIETDMPLNERYKRLYIPLVINKPTPNPVP